MVEAPPSRLMAGAVGHGAVSRARCLGAVPYRQGTDDYRALTS